MFNLLIIIAFRVPRRGKKRGLRRHTKRKADAQITDTDSSVPTVSGTMEGQLIVRVQNRVHDTGSSANGSISDTGDSTTVLCNSRHGGERPRSNSEVCDSPAISDDTDESGPRTSFNSGTTNSENEDNISTDSEFDSDEEGDTFEDRLVMLQRTATQVHEGSGFFLRLGCLREYA